MNIYGIVLAAGKGTRMHSDLPKCAHNVIDKPMVLCVVDTLIKIGAEKIVTVVGYKREEIVKILGSKCDYAFQEEQLGTGHAVNTARYLLNDKDGITIIAAGDMPLIKENTYRELLKTFLDTDSDLTVLTAIQPIPLGYGRIVRNKNGEVLKIVEEKDCTKKQKDITEINAGIYAVKTKKLFELLDKIKPNNKQHEYYLTDIISVARRQNLKITTCTIRDIYEMCGVNTPEQLDEICKHVQNEMIKKHIKNGVIFEDVNDVKIGIDVTIEPGCTIKKGAIILGDCHIKK